MQEETTTERTDAREKYHRRGGHEEAPGLGARLRFMWFCVVGVLFTIPMAICQYVSYRLKPSGDHYKKYSRIWGRWLLLLCGVTVRRANTVQLDQDESYVYVSNHQSLADILALKAVIPTSFGFLAKEELAHVPLIGFATKYSGSIFIDRRDPRKAVESLRVAGERIRGGDAVLIFAEGTRSHSRTLQPFKKGAFAVAVEAGVPLVPVVILDAYRVINEKEHWMRSGTIHISIGSPIFLDRKTRRDIPDLVDAIRDQMESELETHP